MDRHLDFKLPPGQNLINGLASLTQLTSICLATDSPVWAFEPIRSLPNLKFAILEFTKALPTTPLLAQQHLKLLCLRCRGPHDHAPTVQVNASPVH
jgi:hypothetical protein